MPLLTLHLAATAPAAETLPPLHARAAEIVAATLGTPLPLVAVRIIAAPPSTWSVGGKALDDARPAGAMATLALAESSADEARIAAAIAGLTELLRSLPGRGGLPAYVVVERVADALWGHQGRSVAALRAARPA